MSGRLEQTQAVANTSGLKKSVRGQGVARTVAAALAWWAHEIAAFLPVTVRRWTGIEPDLLVVDQTASGFDVGVDRAGRYSALGVLVLLTSNDDPGGRLSQFAQFMRATGIGAKRVVLRLGLDRALRKTVDLPLAAEENLRQVLAYEMERATPFRPDQVRFVHEVKSRDRMNKRLLVELTAVPSDVVAAALAEAARFGIAPPIAVTGQPGTAVERNANLTPESGSIRRYGPIDRLFAAAAALLVVAILAVPLIRYQIALAETEQRLDIVRAGAEAALKSRAELEAELAGAGTVSRIKAGAPSPVLILEELSRLLPDDTWLAQVNIADGEIDIEGLAPSAAALVPILEASPLFADVRFRTPVMRDPLTSREHFALSLKAGQP